jgi:GAF domain-containing protein
MTHEQTDRDRMRRLGVVIAELAAVQSMPELIDTVVSHSATAIGASSASLSVLDEARAMFTMIGLTGGSSGSEADWVNFPLSMDNPAGEAVLNRAPVLVVGRRNIERRYPVLVGHLITADGSLMCLPLIAANRPVGAISLSVPGVWAPDAAEVEFLAMFAATCAQTLERVRARAEANDSSMKLAFLVQASTELASSLDYRATLATVARLAVPALADWCAVQVVDDGVLRTLAVMHADPEKVAMAERLQHRYAPDLEARTGIANVIRTGESALYPEVTDEMLVAGSRDDEYLALARTLQLRSALTVALAVRGRVLGALTLIWAESGRKYAPQDVSFTEDLARRAAVAIDNAHLYSETLEAASRLQQAVLPASLEIPGWEIATVYNSAGRTEVGGDFYDAVLLADGRLAVVIGDVMGRGVAAAAAMAQMRAAVHAYIATDPEPASVVGNLDRMFALFHPARLVTMVYLVLDAVRGELQFVNAGHCPPVLIAADGSVELIQTEPEPPLGVEVAGRAPTRWALPRGFTLLAYTDGLIERRGEAVDAGIERLLRHAPALAGEPLSELLPIIVGELYDDRRDDDTAAITVRLKS